MNTPKPSDSPRQTIRQVLDSIDRTEILDSTTRAKLRAQVTNVDEDAEGLVRTLVKKGLITQYQAVALYQGRTAALGLGPFVFLDRIGAGGVGAVYKACRRDHGNPVAVKVLNAAALRSADNVRRFRREAEAALRLKHPHIVCAQSVGEADGRHYLVMDWIDGTDLSSHVKRNGPLPFATAFNCILQAAEALSYAHGEGIIHRDVKPANILLTRDNQIKLLDLGLARLDDPSTDAANNAQAGLTQTGQVLGTIDYMAPEQALQTRLADARSDVYSLGCTFYRLVTGVNPYGGESVVEKVLAHREHPIPSLRAQVPSVPQATDAVFRRMLAKRPEDRQQTMAEVVDELQRSLTAPAAAVPTLVADPTTLPIGIAVPPAVMPDPQYFPPAPTNAWGAEFPGYSLDLPPNTSLSPVFTLIAVALLVALGASGAVLWKFATQETPIVAEASEGNVAPTPSASPHETTEKRVAAAEPQRSGIAAGTVAQPQQSAAGTAVEAASTRPVAASPVAEPKSTAAPVQPASMTKLIEAKLPATVPPAVAAATASGVATPAPGATAPDHTIAPAMAPVAAAPVVNERSAVPDAAALKTSVQLVRELYAAEFAKAKTQEMQVSLSRLLAKRAQATGDDPVGRFALLQESRNLYLAAGDVSQAKLIAETAAALYKLDVFDWTAEGLPLMKLSTASADACRHVVTEFLPWVDEAVAAERWNAAKALMEITMTAARRTQDTETIRVANERGKQLDKDKQQWDVVEAARAVLVGKPADAGANLLVGKYLCFVEGKWEEGFAYLARSGDLNFKELGEKSLAAPTDFDAVVALGDLWWARSERTTAAAQRREMQTGAVYWYQRVAHQLNGLLKAKIDKRIADVAAAGAPATKSSTAQYLILPLSGDVKLAMRLIPAGRFAMGSPESEIGRSPEEVRHTVVISRPFFMAVTEMTQAQWRAVMGSRERDFTGDVQFPAHSLSPNSIDRCIQTMNAGPYSGTLRFRLPTEAEWEYAARAGTKTTFHWGEDLSLADQFANPNRALERVAQRRPNAWGLFDVAGNVSEICADGYAPYVTSLVVDPYVPPSTLPVSDRRYVVRGQDANTSQLSNRVASRAHQYTSSFSPYQGFRLAVDVIGRIPGDMLTREPPIAAPAAVQGTAGKPTSNPLGAGSPLANTPEVNRALTNWVLQRNGSVSVKFDNRTRFVQKSADMPVEPFVVSTVTFNLQSGPVSDADAAYVARHAWLIGVHCHSPITDLQLIAIAKIPELTNISVFRSRGVTDAGLRTFAASKKLTTISFVETAINGSGLGALADHPSLERLELRSNPLSPREMTQLGRLRSVKYLTLSESDVNDAVVKQIGELTQLRDLSLNNTAITNVGIGYLANLSQLSSLYLMACSVTNIDPLAHCRELTTLELSRTKVDGQIDKALQELPKLRTLGLRDTVIGDAIVPTLLKLEQLEYLNLSGTKVTKDAIGTLKRARPNVRITD